MSVIQQGMSVTHKPCIVTMIGGIDVLGELPEQWPSSGFVAFKSPVRFGINREMQKFEIVPMPVMNGDHIVINMAAVLWVIDPPKALVDAYRLRRAGLTLPDKPLALRVNE
jgi:hypothetical protein